MNEMIVFENDKLIIAKETRDKLIAFKKAQLEIDLLEKELKKQAKEKMEEFNVPKILMDGLSIIYKGEYERSSIDTKALENELGAEFLERFKKTTKVSASLSISVE
jgi:hypothetical protein